MGSTASVIIRAKDKAATIERTLQSVRSQTVASEVIVVDSGSTDATLDIAASYADLVVEIPPEEFTYGGALNRGAEAATGDVHFALSAHSWPHEDTWVERSLQMYDREDVAGTNGALASPQGDPITGAYHQTPRDAVTHGWWGFSNHGSSWRADVWRELPFRTDLAAAEDKEWSWRVLAAGWTIAYSPDLVVSALHRRQAGFLPLARRVVKERTAMLELGGVRPRGPLEALSLWATVEPVPGARPAFLRRVNPWRLVEHGGEFVADRRYRDAPADPTFARLREQVTAATATTAGAAEPAGALDQTSGPVAPLED